MVDRKNYNENLKDLRDESEYAKEQAGQEIGRNRDRVGGFTEDSFNSVDYDPLDRDRGIADPLQRDPLHRDHTEHGPLVTDDELEEVASKSTGLAHGQDRDPIIDQDYDEKGIKQHSRDLEHTTELDVDDVYVERDSEDLGDKIEDAAEDVVDKTKELYHKAKRKIKD